MWIFSRSMIKSYDQFKNRGEDLKEAVTIFGGLDPKWGSYENGPRNHQSRPLGNWQSDNAWDIFAKAGTPVYSITSGKVKKVKDTGKKSGKVYGTHVTVDSSGRDPQVFYTHLKNVSVKPGDKIEAGDVIGEISEWGDSKSTHVHIGLSNNKHIRDYMKEDGTLLLVNPESSSKGRKVTGGETPMDVRWDTKYTDATAKSNSNVMGFLRFLQKRKEKVLADAGGSQGSTGLFTLLNLPRLGSQASPMRSTTSITPKATTMGKGPSPMSVANDLHNEISPVVGSIVPKGKASSHKENIEIVISALNKYGIVNPLIQKGILSVIGKESGFAPKNEHAYNNTSNERIRKYFGSRVSNYTESELTDLKKDVDRFWDVVYGGRYGNDSPGDGSKYRGRGFNQLTFKDSYKKYNDLLKKNGTNVDIVNNPEMVNDPKIAAEVAALFFLNRLNSRHSKKKYGNDDPNDFTNFDTALKAATNANAGWGKNIEGSKSLSNAREYAANFDIVNTDGSMLA
jgi:predicted chitinase